MDWHDIIVKTIPYLGPRSLLNLALTSYEYYEPCIKQLYRHIVVARRRLNQISDRQHFNHSTFIDGLGLGKKDDILINVKLQVLIQSLTINPQLIEYIGKFEVFGKFDEEVNSKIKKIISMIKCPVYIDDLTLRKGMDKGRLIKPTTEQSEVTLNLDKPVDLLSMKIDWSKVKKLVLIYTQPYDHKTSELIDLSLLKFFNNPLNINYIVIKYNPPKDGLIDDGFEGNYLRRIRILTTMIKIISRWPVKVNLVLPDFLQVLSCYEQSMNHMMWNGCKCVHCDKYLVELDDFIHRHKYWDQKLNYWKDLDNSIMINQLGQFFQYRYTNTTEYDYLNQLQLVDFNIHKNFFSGIDFQCFDSENVEHSEYNDEEDVFFDALETVKHCKFNELFQHLNISMIHYLETIIVSLIDLDRGDAESRDLIDEFLNDGENQINLCNLGLNGFQFYFDSEINGTNFFKSYYDQISN
ncbi:hypothetical protein CLIB1444_15S01992 [[Candida] jaroonii]|uniref:Uncharacterized protein n=1 Tax=[Candida] jaroonii TaxID=467808 RepID=A0ACA9YEY1_9ASCO|nr:hypothetical protein CLIB1444_15S01992 [[Candida] jaroonii]